MIICVLWSDGNNKNQWKIKKKNPFDFSDVLHKETIAYMCLNMINFDAVDCSERRSEEVTSFSWRSV